jgi:hypothetical protein
VRCIICLFRVHHAKSLYNFAIKTIEKSDECDGIPLPTHTPKANTPLYIYTLLPNSSEQVFLFSEGLRWRREDIMQIGNLIMI